MTADEKINALVDSQSTLTNQLKELLARDPRKEFIYGPNYSPTSRRFQRIAWQTQYTVASPDSFIFASPIDNEEVIILATLSAVGGNLRVEMDDYIDFRNVPKDFSTRTMFIKGVASNSFSISSSIPLTHKFIRISVTGGTTPLTAANWPVSVLSVGWLGQ